MMDLKTIIALIIRLFGTAVITWLAATGSITSDQATAIVVAVVFTIIMAAWSIIQKWSGHQAVQTALNMQAGSSVDQLKREMNLS